MSEDCRHLDFEGPMPIYHGPYSPIDIDRTIPPEDGDWIDYDYSLGRVLRDEGLVISDDQLQLLYQFERNRRSIESSLNIYSLAGEEGVAVAKLYWSIQDEMRRIVDFEKHTDFEEVFMDIVDREVRREQERYDDEHDEYYERVAA